VREERDAWRQQLSAADENRFIAEHGMQEYGRWNSASMTKRPRARGDDRRSHSVGHNDRVVRVMSDDISHGRM
jgi:hypothetical protein